ncbi:MAG: MotA/TolQ/ExbB proton channel family protein [Bacteroidales bacterium]|nr:MotA/TolQ/ExbB proton channel family protein [Bacteroidales bacterium]
MKDLFFTGGTLFMSVLTILLVIMVAWMIYHLSKYIYAKQASKEKALRKAEQGRSIGLFALIFGIMGQLIGIYGAFSSIVETTTISPALIYSGLKVSMITTMYGLVIYLIAIILWFGSQQIIDKRD